MNRRLNIRQLLYLLIAIGSVITLIYVSVTYIYIKDVTSSALQKESLNRAYYAAKKTTEAYDKIAYEYRKREGEQYRALEEAQAYFKTNGRQASLEVLKKKLTKGDEGSVYEVLLISKEMIIEQATFKPDIGLDFKKIPEARSILKRVYENPKTIDLSPIFYDNVAVTFKRYIVQRAIDADYLVQLSMQLDKSHALHTSIASLQKDVPNLVNSSLFQIFSDSITPFYVERQWLIEHTLKDKTEWMETRHDLEDFKVMMTPMLTLPNGAVSRAAFSSAISKVLDEEHYLEHYFWLDGRYIHRVLLPFFSYVNTYDDSQHLLVMDFDESEALHTLETMKYLMALLGLFLISLVIAVIWLLRSRIITPLVLIQQQMKQKQNVDLTKIPNRTDEMGSITFTYNQLLSDLKREILSNEELLAEFKIFTANAIHQIRTPLSVIKIALEMLESQNKEAEQQIAASLISIEHMYDSLSYMVQHDKVEYVIEKINLSALFAERVKLFQVVAQANDITFDLHIEPDLFTMMNRMEAEYLIDNNLSNAIKFGEPEKVITLSLRRTKDELILSFVNYGQQIRNVETIFQRHVREDETKHGSGIGLNMVELICKRNNILINVDYKNGQNRFLYYIEPI